MQQSDPRRAGDHGETLTVQKRTLLDTIYLFDRYVRWENAQFQAGGKRINDHIAKLAERNLAELKAQAAEAQK